MAENNNEVKEVNVNELVQEFVEKCRKNGKIAMKEISKLAEADVAYFAPGWEDARGCRIEHQCAINYGIEIIEDHCY